MHEHQDHVCWLSNVWCNQTGWKHRPALLNPPTSTHPGFKQNIMKGNGLIVQAPEWTWQLKYVEICRVCLSNQQLKQSWRCWRESCGLLDSAKYFTEPFEIPGIPAPCAALALRKSISWDSTKSPTNQINRSPAKWSLGCSTDCFFSMSCFHFTGMKPNF